MSKERTIEENFNDIETIISKMEKDEISLEDSFSLYENGLKLIKECNNKIEKVEKQMKVIEEKQINE